MGTTKERIQILHSPRDVLLVLGGTRPVMRLTGVSEAAVSNWRSGWSKIPANKYTVINDALEKRGYQAKRELFSLK